MPEQRWVNIYDERGVLTIGAIFDSYETAALPNPKGASRVETVRLFTKADSEEYERGNYAAFRAGYEFARKSWPNNYPFDEIAEEACKEAFEEFKKGASYV